VDRCLDRPGAKAKQAREPPVGRATSLNSSAESKCVLGTSPLAHAADEGDVHSRVSATAPVKVSLIPTLIPALTPALTFVLVAVLTFAVTSTLVLTLVAVLTFAVTSTLVLTLSSLWP